MRNKSVKMVLIFHTIGLLQNSAVHYAWWEVTKVKDEKNHINHTNFKQHEILDHIYKPKRMVYYNIDQDNK